MYKTSLPGLRQALPATRGAVLMLLLALAGCTANPPAGAPAALGEDAVQVAPLTYYQMLQRMTPAQIARERMVLAALPPTPTTQLRTAMVLGHPRGPLDLARALSLLDGLLKSTEPTAVGLQPLARLLADNYAERQKLEAQLEKQGQQLKDSQRKAAELQEKIDSLADIERTLPQRPRTVRPVGGAK